MISSPFCYEVIKHFEHLELRSYVCPAGKLTIGYGHTKNVKKGQQITEEQAEAFLKDDVQNFEAQLLKALNADEIEINQNQFDALISFAFNLGIANLIGSTLWKKLIAKNLKGAAEEFSRWIYATRKVTIKEKSYTVREPLRGLCARRLTERDLFNGDLKFYRFNSDEVNAIVKTALKEQKAKSIHQAVKDYYDEQLDRIGL